MHLLRTDKINLVNNEVAHFLGTMFVTSLTSSRIIKNFSCGDFMITNLLSSDCSFRS